MFVRIRESKGFTLVELMIVVAIIGILASVAAPYYQKYVQKSRLTSKVFPGVHVIETNLASYYAFQQTFPSGSTFDALVVDADTQYFTPSINNAGSSVLFTIKGNGTTNPLYSLDGKTLSASPVTSGGKIVGWQLGNSLATLLGLAGEK